MRIIAWANLLDFADAHPTTRQTLMHWRAVVRAAEWKTMADAGAACSKAKSVCGDRIRYEIAGGDYRLIVAYDFRRQVAFVKFIGTHADYDRVDAATVAMF
jgi:mRNA interferase HigB